MTRGQLARKFNINPETIRYYENFGLIRPDVDPNSGYRQYNDFQISKLDLILRFKELGFSLKEIGTFFLLLENSAKKPGQLQHYINIKVEEIDGRIEAYLAMKEALIKFRDREDRETCEVFSKFINRA